MFAIVALPRSLRDALGHEFQCKFQECGRRRALSGMLFVKLKTIEAQQDSTSGTDAKVCSKQTNCCASQMVCDQAIVTCLQARTRSPP